MPRLSPSNGPTVAETLEEGVQLQQNDSDYVAAIRCYENVLRHEEKWAKLAAEARFRMAECHLAKGNPKKAREQIEKLRKNYPADNRWVEKADKLMPAETAFSGAPWKDGHLYRYDVKLRNGKQLGSFILAEKKVQEEGPTQWESYLVRSAGNQSLSRSRFAEEGYRMIESRWYLQAMGDKEIQFGDNGFIRLLDSDLGKEIDSYDHSTGHYSKMPLYENEQMVQLLRTLNLEVGTKQHTVLFAAFNGLAPIEFDMEVTSHEEVEVPAGTFNCAKIETSLKQTFYIHLEDHHQLVKIEMGGASVLLSGEQAWDDQTSRPLSSNKHGISFEIPGPMLDMPAIDNKNVFRVQLWSTDFAGRDALLEVNKLKNLLEEVRNQAADQQAKTFAEVVIRGAAKNMNQWAAVEDSWEEVEVDGAKGIALRATGKQGDIPVHEYQVYVISDGKALALRINHTASEADQAKDRAWEILDRFKW